MVRRREQHQHERTRDERGPPTSQGGTTIRNVPTTGASRRSVSSTKAGMSSGLLRSRDHRAGASVRRTSMLPSPHFVVSMPPTASVSRSATKLLVGERRAVDAGLDEVADHVVARLGASRGHQRLEVLVALAQHLADPLDGVLVGTSDVDRLDDRDPALQVFVPAVVETDHLRDDPRRQLAGVRGDEVDVTRRRHRSPGRRRWPGPAARTRPSAWAGTRG